MKPLHLGAAKDELRPALEHIQINNNLVVVTDATMLAVIPVSEVFPEGIIQPGEELYIHSHEWKVAKLDKAAGMRREGNRLFALDKKNLVTGMCELKPEPDFIYPNWPNVVPEDKAIKAAEIISFDPKYLSLAAQLIGGPSVDLYITLHKYSDSNGNPRIGIMRSLQEECAGYAVIFPTIAAEYALNDKKDDLLT